MKKVLCLSLISLLSLSGEICAEGRCPAGMFETGSRDYLVCVPIPGYGQGNNDYGSDNRPPAKPMVWEKRWGAVARETGGAGLAGVNGFRTEAAAKQAALTQCQATATNSKAACKVTLPYHNQCAAFAWGEGWGVAFAGVDLAKATEEALKSCNRKASSTCEIFYSGCSFDELVPE